MIDGFNLRFGPAPGSAPLSVASPSITVFVGPNNSGKSKVLQEIYASCVSGDRSGNKILDNIEFTAISREEAQADLDAFRSEPRPGDNVGANAAMIQIGHWRSQVHIPHFLEARISPNAADHRRSHFAQYYAQHFTANLNGANRMALVEPQERGDLKFPETTFARLLTSDEKREALRDTIFEAVGLYIGIDMSRGSLLQLRFGTSAPPNERSVEDATLEWMRDALPVPDVSDGIKAFSGILIQLRTGDPRIVIIDEPEAFLHPALASKLGKEVARLATQGGKQVFVSTHSPQFLMGAIQSGARIDVVRLTHRGGIGTARLLSNADVALMMRDPLLRSTNALAGLFYENVVVTEADADRAFYQELNDRMLEQGRGLPHTLFVNGNGKDTVHRIVEPLRRLGIPAAAILDIDALKVGGANWLAHLAACRLPPAQYQQYQNQRAAIWNLLEAAGDPKRDGGVQLLQGQDREAAENLINDLAAYGLFILSGGEVEHWLPRINVPRNKTWLHNIFDALGSDPGNPNYVRPANDDVWAFLDRVSAWARNANRRGNA